METPKTIMDPLKTRGDFRQAIGSGQQQREGELNRRESLAEAWAALADAYGNAFTSQFGEEPNQTWADALSRFDWQDVMLAVGRVIDSGGEYAPNLSTVMRELNQKSAPFQHLQQRPAREVLQSESTTPRSIASPATMEAQSIATPLENPDYFRQVWEGLE